MLKYLKAWPIIVQRQHVKGCWVNSMENESRVPPILVLGVQLIWPQSRTANNLEGTNVHLKG